MHSNKLLTKGRLLPKASISSKPIAEFDKYEIVNDANSNAVALGEGASGKVFLVRKKATNELFVLKGLGKTDTKSLRSLKKEAEIQIRLIHNNIIRLHEFIEGPQSTLLVMEYARYGSLNKLLKERGHLTEEQAFSYFIQVCDAVHFLHSHDLIHRDIKPSNLLFISPSQVKLADFDCCTCSNYRLKVLCGTSEYIAPEVLSCKPYDQKADVWSLGILLFEMVHGYTPFKARRRRDTYLKIFKGKIIFSEQIKNDLKDLIVRILRLEDKGRPTIEEILNHPWIQRMSRKSLEDKENVKKNSVLDVIERTENTVIEERDIEEISPSMNHNYSACDLIQDKVKRAYIFATTRTLSSKRKSYVKERKVMKKNNQNEFSMLSLFFPSTDNSMI